MPGAGASPFGSATRLASRPSPGAVLSRSYADGLHRSTSSINDGKELGSLVETEKSRQLAEEDSKSPSGVDSSMLDKVQDFDTSSSFAKATKRQKLIFLLLFLRELTAYTGSAVMAPLFPGEAESRGVSTTVSGWIFGVFPLVQFLSSPLAGRLIPVLGAKVMLISGSFVYGLCTLLFGCLDFLPPTSSPILFISLCFINRIILALGNAFAVTAVYAISTYTFSNNPATALGILETAVGMGMMAGPVIGGALYQAGGFDLPFIVIGAVCLALIPAYHLVISIDTAAGFPGEMVETISLTRLLRIPAISLISIAVLLSAAFWGALDPTLEPHLEQYELGIFKVSLIFLLMAGIYAISSPLVGLAADKLHMWPCWSLETLKTSFNVPSDGQGSHPDNLSLSSDSNPLIIFGFLLMAVFYFILGPSPWLHWTSNLRMDLVSLSVIALGLSLSSVPNIAKMIASAETSGIDNSMALHGTVAGLYNGVYALGDALGPVFGSWTTDVQGFGMSMTYLSGISVMTVVALCILWICDHKHSLICHKHTPRTVYTPATEQNSDSMA